jgi:hypothetical protein
VIRLQTALGEQLFHIAERERVPKIPAHGTQNQLRCRLPPLEDCRSGCVIQGLFRLPATPAKVATHPENLFLRKQLAFYQERNIRPRRTSHPAQLTLVLLSRWFNWRSALTVVTPRTFISWQRKRYQLFWRNQCQAGRPRIPPDLQRLIRTMRAIIRPGARSESPTSCW